MNFLSVDLETTGLKTDTHGIIQFAAVYADVKATFGPRTFYRWVLPERMVWSQYCLDMHYEWIGIVNKRVKAEAFGTEADGPAIMNNYDQLITQFTNWYANLRLTERITPAGKNFGTFDLRFLEHLKFPNIFKHRVLDPGILYLRKTDEVIPDFATCKARAIERGCDISPSVAHNALDDAMDVVKLIQCHYKQWSNGYDNAGPTSYNT